MELLFVLGLIVLIGLVIVLIYNRLVALRQTTRQAWGDIDVQLKQRHDLVPNLVETVKGYASHEKETLERVVAARQQAVDAGSTKELAQAENMLTGALRQLFALSEAYPDLKANQNFLCRMSWRIWKTRSRRRVAFSTMRSPNTIRRSSSFRPWFWRIRSASRKRNSSKWPHRNGPRWKPRPM